MFVIFTYLMLGYRLYLMSGHSLYLMLGYSLYLMLGHSLYQRCAEQGLLTSVKCSVSIPSLTEVWNCS